MLSQPVIATMFVLGLLTVGEVISILTRARVPMLFVVIMGYLVLLWAGILPKSLVENSTLGTIGALMTAPLIVHMGTLIPLKMIRRQWRAAVINLTGLVFATVLVLVVGSLVLGYRTAAASVGPVTGGIVAFIITSTKLKQLGLASLVALPALVLSFHGMVGLPMAANFLRRYTRRFVQSVESQPFTAATLDPAIAMPSSTADKPTVATRRALISHRYETNVTMLFQVFIGASLAVFLGTVTPISYSLWALLIGFVGAYVGFYHEKVLERSNAFGLAMAGLIVMLLPSMNSVTVTTFINYLPKILLIVALGTVGLVLGGYIGSKIFRWHPAKGIAVALTAMFGFPGDYLLCEEVSRSEGKTEEQRQLILNEILTPMLVGGFTSVTTASVVIASILMSTLK